MKISQPGIAAPDSIPRLNARLVTDLALLEVLRDSWQALERAPTDHGAAFFQSFAWSRHVASVRLERSPDRFRLAVATIHDGAELIGIWPLSLQKRSGIWTLRNLDDPFGQFAGILCSRADWIEACVQAVLKLVRAAGLADAVCISNVQEGSPLAEAMLAAGAHTAGSNEIVQVDMRAVATFADYQRTLNAKTRKNLRNAMNRLARHGEVEHFVLDQPAALGALIQQSFAGRLEWMRLHGKSTDAFRDADFRPIIEKICSAAGLSALGFELRSKGEVIASQWGFVHEGRYYAYISARDHGHDQFSPGRLHLGNVIEACKSRGLDVIELMAPAARYKLMWSDRAGVIHDLWLPLTMRGRLTLAFMEFAIPAAKTVARALPARLKSRLADKVNSP